MDDKQLFKLSRNLALPSWALMALFPTHHYTGIFIKFSAALLAVMYIYSLVTAGRTKGASFSTFKGVLTIFRQGSDRVVNACWIHFLAFDMLIGYQMALSGHAEGIPQLLVAPFLFGTLMFGPGGWVAFEVMKYIIQAM
jgi:hypothetical protein